MQRPFFEVLGLWESLPTAAARQHAPKGASQAQPQRGEHPFKSRRVIRSKKDVLLSVEHFLELGRDHGRVMAEIMAE